MALHDESKEPYKAFLICDNKKRPIYLILFACVMLVSIPISNSSIMYNLVVGAYGDSSSIGNLGIQAEIRTNIYHLNAPDQDFFWVANRLENGAFIQFGYGLASRGAYCSSALIDPSMPFSCQGRYQTVNGSEPLWFWTYFPNASGSSYYYGQGSPNSVGVNGTWHRYSMIPLSQGGWSFQLDGKQVATVNFTATRSSDRVFVAAEKSFQFAQSTLSTQPAMPGPLGPVEFRNLAYLEQDGWHPVTALYAIVNCGVNPNCIPIPYGVSPVGPNHIIAGTSVNQPHDKELLWSSVPTESSGRADHTTLIFLCSAVVVAVLAVAIIILLRRLSKPSRSFRSPRHSTSTAE